jgi:cytochrome c oxidase assembly protein subunit 19
MNFSSAKQTIKPPQRGIFPLDHDAECKPFKEKYLSCLKDEGDKHHLCRDFSKEYLQCRMDRNLMASEDLDRVRYSFVMGVRGLKCHDDVFSYVLLILFSTITSVQLFLQLGFSKEATVEKAVEYDKSKEKGGYVAGKHIDGRIKWWFQR